MRAASAIGERVLGLARRAWATEDIQFVLRCVCLMALMTVVRPAFAAPVPAESYQASSIVWDLLQRDVGGLIRAAQRQKPEVPRILFLVFPSVVLWLSRERIGWERWEAGRALRVFVMTLLLVLAWAGSTFDYNLYLDRFHAIDRLLLVALAALSWRSPLVVPLATAWAVVMLKEPYAYMALDDFDFRSLADVLIVFSCFVWVSFRKSFATKHFVWVALGAWAAYYYVAGVSKMTYGPRWSWLLENHLSNLSASAYVRGWANAIPESLFLPFVGLVRRADVAMAAFCAVVELGSIAAFHVHPRVTRLWLLACAVFHVGIFALSGIFFWKWIVANLAFWWFLRRGGAPILAAMCRHKAGIVLAVVALFYSGEKLYFFPQTGVVWFDSRFVENYEIVAVGAETGESYLVDPSSIAPMEMHWVQGRLCYASGEPSLTGIYGTTGSHAVYTALENAKTADDVKRLLARSRRCGDAAQQKGFDDFMVRYFGTMNRRGRPHGWLDWIGRPTHLWVQPRGRLFDQQEPIAKIELWRELVLHDSNALHRFDRKLVREVGIPQRTAQVRDQK